MAFTDAYNLNWTLTVNDAENATEPFKDSKSRSFKFDRTGALPGGGGPGLVVVGFAADDIILVDDLNALGVMTIENIDPTNFVDVGPTDTGTGLMQAMVRILPGESFPFRLTPGIVLRARADTADVRCTIRIYEN